MSQGPEREATLAQPVNMVSIPAKCDMEGLQEMGDWRFRACYNYWATVSEGNVKSFLDEQIMSGGGSYQHEIPVYQHEGFDFLQKIEVRVWRSRDDDLRISVSTIEVSTAERAKWRRNWAGQVTEQKDEKGAVIEEIGIASLRNICSVLEAGDEWGEEVDVHDVLVVGATRCLRQKVIETLEGQRNDFLLKGYSGHFYFQEEGENLGAVQGFVVKTISSDSARLSGSITTADFLLQGIYFSEEVPIEAMIFKAMPYPDEQGNLEFTTFSLREVFEAADYDFTGVEVDRYEVTVLGVPDEKEGGRLYLWVDRG
jgi:hypothetical protein